MALPLYDAFVYAFRRTSLFVDGLYLNGSVVGIAKSPLHGGRVSLVRSRQTTTRSGQPWMFMVVSDDNWEWCHDGPFLMALVVGACFSGKENLAKWDKIVAGLEIGKGMDLWTPQAKGKANYSAEYRGEVKSTNEAKGDGGEVGDVLRGRSQQGDGRGHWQWLPGCWKKERGAYPRARREKDRGAEPRLQGVEVSVWSGKEGWTEGSGKEGWTEGSGKEGWTGGSGKEGWTVRAHHGLGRARNSGPTTHCGPGCVGRCRGAAHDTQVGRGGQGQDSPQRWPVALGGGRRHRSFPERRQGSRLPDREAGARDREEARGSIKRVVEGQPQQLDRSSTGVR
ncbi:unnamed protein product [Pylaiella littoralis]